VLEQVSLGFAAGLSIAFVTAPVGVSGAVFLLPVQLSVLQVPNPAVTPTNLLYNVISGPGALLRYRRAGQADSHLTRRLLVGTLPGVVLGAFIRVLVLPGARTFRVVAGLTLLAIGAWLVGRVLRPRLSQRTLSDPALSVLAFAVGVVGGVYGIGGGSILSPVLVGSGMALSVVAPAALTSTFLTSVVGALSYAVLALFVDGSIAPRWSLGIACGLGGLLGGYLGARVQSRIPDEGLKLMLGGVAAAIGLFYLYQALM
jgi:uncharacterized protein